MKQSNNETMNKKLLKQLILASYTNGALDEKNILAITDRLTRAELKQYIKALKQSEKAKTVIVDIPFYDTKSQNLQSVFPSKKIIVRKDPSLLVGIRVTDNDDVFEMNLKHELDAIIKTIDAD